MKKFRITTHCHIILMYTHILLFIIPLFACNVLRSLSLREKQPPDQGQHVQEHGHSNQNLNPTQNSYLPRYFLLVEQLIQDVQTDEKLAANQADHLAALKCYKDKLIQLFDLHHSFQYKQILATVNSNDTFVTKWLLQNG